LVAIIDSLLAKMLFELEVAICDLKLVIRVLMSV